MTCRRCGGELALTLERIPRCFDCARRAYDEIDRLVAGLRAESDRLHQNLSVIAEAQEAQSGAAA